MGGRGGRLPEIVLVLFACASCMQVYGQVLMPPNTLKLHFYKANNACTYVEEFVKHQVRLAWEADHSITAALLRLLYSDCFVTGCDASVLLDGKTSEKAAPQNMGLRGFELIDRIKKVLESRCRGVVSCSDILNLATRDAVGLAGAPKYPVFTGRRDGMKSSAASVDLPSPSISWDKALHYFQSRGLNILDLGTLLGAHTLGKTNCSFLQDRLYNFNGTGRRDPTIKLSFYGELRKKCPRTSRGDATVFLNPESGANYSFESSYYSRVLTNEAVLGIDQQFIFSSDGVRIADEFATGFEDFRRAFALAMFRMGNVGVLTGTQGEIRRHCRYTNADNPDVKQINTRRRLLRYANSSGGRALPV